jgi:hypothetical protein
MSRVFFAILSALTIFLLTGAPTSMALGAGGDRGTAVASADPQADSPAAGKVSAKVDVDVDGHQSGAWYLSPTWIVIGILAIGVLVAIIVAASRGGTTVIKD